MTEIGFLAAGTGQAEQAQIILEGVQVMRPGHGQAFIGMAMAHLNAGRAAEAVRVLQQEALPKVVAEDQDMLKAFLALALKLDGRPREAGEVLDALDGEARDEAAIKLAAAIRESL
ncbi:tetratricopeptide repeat protein [Telmatospirillum sp. J64-1]|uniref:tetratricopeptide repeat protein n=1 Tax=Telmatospirillum sp. J64-1 TaxID=2502183 RepID=UPI00163DAF5D|nr:tetratricopeptide repeat protein [Telmatospirillum sp. J64-1]